MSKHLILLLVGRDDWQRDGALNLTLLELLKRHPFKVLWEDPAAEAIYLLRRFEKSFSWLPASIKKLNLRLVQIAYGLFHPWYFLRIYRIKNNAIFSRCNTLKRLIRKLDIAERTVILSRSSGGRIASLIADELQLKQIVCLGYPFKHPHMQDEPDRYTHLASITTPMLIIQGSSDSYGGAEIRDIYSFSKSIELHFINTDHNFDINEEAAHEIVKKIENFIGITQTTTANRP